MLRIASLDVAVIFPECTIISPTFVASPNIPPVIDGDVVDVEPDSPIVTVPVDVEYIAVAPDAFRVPPVTFTVELVPVLFIT